MSDAKKDIKAKVAARVQEELASAPPAEKKEQKLPLDFLMQCLRHNRIGDATLIHHGGKGFHFGQAVHCSPIGNVSRCPK